MDIRERLAKIRFFPIKPNLAGFSAGEKSAIKHCVSAAKVMNDVYLEQIAHGNRGVFEALKARTDENGKDLLRYFSVHGCPWDAYDHDAPFVPGVGPRPKFGSFYPEDFSKEEWEQWLAAHPEDRGSFENPCTVIERRESKLAAVPYSRKYLPWLSEAANNLRAAARFLPAGNLKTFLELRAKAFLTNNYFESDLAWIDTNGHPFEVTVGPYEVYFDGLLGLKAAFEAFVAIPDKEATAALGKFSSAVPEFDEILSREFNFKPKGSAIPLEVVEEIYRGGEAASSYLFVAYNLPNDRIIHELKGSKKVFSRTMMQAKYDNLILPVAERIYGEADLAQCNFNNRLIFVLGHELAHGLGPSFVKIGDRDVPFETALGDLHSCLEEAKADMLGVRLLRCFSEKGLLQEEILVGAIISEIATYMSGFRQGYTEAHSRGHLIQYNWLTSRDAVRYDRGKKRLTVDVDRAIEAMCDLSTEFINVQAAGNYDRASAFMKQWSDVPAEIPEIVSRLEDIPASVRPIYELNF